MPLLWTLLLSTQKSWRIDEAAWSPMVSWPITTGKPVGHNGDLDLVNEGPSKIKMFRDGHLISRSPYYVRAY